MLKIRKLFIGCLLLTTTGSFAKDTIKILSCKSLSNFQKFEVLLDPSTYRDGSGYFVPKYASLVDNYYSVKNMTCVGSTPSSIECIGYVNGISETIMEAKTSKDANNKILLSYTVIRGFGPEDRTLQCELRDPRH